MINNREAAIHNHEAMTNNREAVIYNREATMNNREAMINDREAVIYNRLYTLASPAVIIPQKGYVPTTTAPSNRLTNITSPSG